MVCGETRKPQNLEECLRGVQGMRVPVESSVNDCSESCCLERLHKHRCAGTLDARAAGGSTCASFLLCPSPQVPFMWLHSYELVDGWPGPLWNRNRGLGSVFRGLGSVLLFSNLYDILVLNRLAESMQQNQARGLLRVLGLMGIWQCVCVCVKM